MNECRNRILQRLRRNQPEIPADADAAEPPAAARMDPQQKIDSFTRRMQAVRAEVHLCRHDNWLQTLAQLLKEKRIGNLLYGPEGPLGAEIDAFWQQQPQLPPLLSHEESIEQWKDSIFFEAQAAITSTRAGIADIGSLVLWPTPQEPRSYSLVPPIHIAVLDEAKLYGTFAELVEREQWRDGLPTNTLLISGPSKTADIEQTLAYGIHGPVELIILLRHR